jgi:hypothetical protein
VTPLKLLARLTVLIIVENVKATVYVDISCKELNEIAHKNHHRCLRSRRQKAVGAVSEDQLLVVSLHQND